MFATSKCWAVMSFPHKEIDVSQCNTIKAASADAAECGGWGVPFNVLCFERHGRKRRVAARPAVRVPRAASAGLASAAEVRVLSVGSTQVGARALAADFAKATGHTVNFTIRPPFNIDEEFGKNLSLPKTSSAGVTAASESEHDCD
jgi:hypothetical protein